MFTGKRFLRLDNCGAVNSFASLELCCKRNSSINRSNRFGLKYELSSQGMQKSRQNNRFAGVSSSGARKRGQNSGDVRSRSSFESRDDSTYKNLFGVRGNKNDWRDWDREYKSRAYDRRNRVPRFENKTGSSRAQEALKLVILNVGRANSRYQVNFRNLDGKLETLHLLEISNSLDLTEQGISCSGGAVDMQLPIVKIIPAKEMLQKYLDEVAAQVEKKLLASGSLHAKKVVENRLKAERKKSAAKIVNLLWNISVGDFENQKTKEIEKRITTGERFSIIVGHKSSLAKRRRQLKEVEGLVGLEVVEETQKSSLDHLDDEDYEFELKKRERLFERIELILVEHRCKNSISGSLETQMFLSVHPIKATVQEPPKQEKEIHSAKELRRMKRMEKLKSQQPAQTLEVNDDDPDAMYLFKIE